ncbi:CATRA system-associated protein [Actinokineospora cianjurensis]|uniref:CATRA-Associated Small Protein domain-containing protein n=1 Tax=Actinokineospora cianjurensis TaxID=585224 RepID=A0A421B582_9PSEU|nr:CATRA system-associated protein [Actinokineospora cianjurensis]RLK59612.1 hypothetical protein CLV68_0093 [Actinokineospora cianjurensis]
MPTDDALRDGALVEKVRAAALQVLGNVLRWRVAARRWPRLADLVAAVEHAVAAGDTAALDIAAANLEAATPFRNQQINQPPEARVGAPDELRERINRLQHDLGRHTDEEDADAGSRGDR